MSRDLSKKFHDPLLLRDPWFGKRFPIMPSEINVCIIFYVVIKNVYYNFIYFCSEGIMIFQLSLVVQPFRP